MLQDLGMHDKCKWSTIDDVLQDLVIHDKCKWSTIDDVLYDLGRPMHGRCNYGTTLCKEDEAFSIA